MINDYLVGEQTLADGLMRKLRAGPMGELLTGEMSGKHFEHTLRGRMFLYTINSQALLLAATTGGHPTIINPVGSSVLFVPLALRIGFISGTTVIGSVLIAETLSVGGGAATAAPILTATLVTPKNALRGGGRVNKTQWSPTTNTFTAAPTVIMPSGINLGAAAPTGTGTYESRLDGALAFMPGTAMSVVYSVTTSTALFQITVVGLELPLPSQAA